MPHIREPARDGRCPTAGSETARPYQLRLTLPSRRARRPPVARAAFGVVTNGAATDNPRLVEHNWPVEDHQVVAAILRQEGYILLCHRSPLRLWFPNVWDFPGGHVHSGEDPEDALRRELAEKLGVVLEDLGGEPVLRRIDSEAGLDLTIWVSRRWRGTPMNRQPEEHDAIGWFERDQLAGLSFADPSYLTLLQDLLIE